MSEQPKCPVHRDAPMVLADGKAHYHDRREPHWRCELWVGSGVCGQTLPLSPRCGFIPPTPGGAGDTRAGAARMAQKWEYLTITDDDGIELSSYGADGWELVSVEWRHSWICKAVFKRPVR